jgi:hypothetical protein
LSNTTSHPYPLWGCLPLTTASCAAVCPEQWREVATMLKEHLLLNLHLGGQVGHPDWQLFYSHHFWLACYLQSFPDRDTCNWNT